MDERDRDVRGRARRTLRVLALVFFVFALGGAVNAMTGYWVHYGYALFVGLPFVAGIWAAYQELAERGSEPTFNGTFLLPFILVATAVVVFAVGAEGLICLAMAFPLYVPVALIAYFFGKAVFDFTYDRVGPKIIVLLVVGFVGGLHAIEYHLDPTPPLRKVSSSIAINAAPETVWRNVVEFPEIPEPTEWYFNAGIAYPISATIEGRGPGAIRKCEFTTGPFVEPIEVWDEPRRLQFAVTENPPPMKELSFRSDVDPPHLHGAFVSERGEFVLEETLEGTTILHGNTWYRHDLWPNAYWSQWTNALIHRIHLRVLEHIKVHAERDADETMFAELS